MNTSLNIENNMGNIDENGALSFFEEVISDMNIYLEMSFTDAGSACINNKIYIDRRDLSYPWYTKQLILHEIAHYLTPDDYMHGTRFNKRYAELVLKYMGKITMLKCPICKLGKGKKQYTKKGLIAHIKGVHNIDNSGMDYVLKLSRNK